MRRVLVIGCGGAGKTTFAQALAKRTNLPLIHLDREFWQPDWTQTPRNEWRAKVARLVAEPAWIIEGHFDGSLDVRLPRADTVVWFDMTRQRCVSRVLKRIVTNYGQVRPDMAPGCPEKIDFAFLKWIWNFNLAERPRILVMLERHGPHLTPAVFRHDRDASAFLTTAQPRWPEP